MKVRVMIATRTFFFMRSLGRRATAARNLKEFFSRVIVHLFDYDDRISAGAQ